MCVPDKKMYRVLNREEREKIDQEREKDKERQRKGKALQGDRGKKEERSDLTDLVNVQLRPYDNFNVMDYESIY